MSTYESKKIRFLGETPTHIEQEKVLDYFLYTFEFIWTAPAYDIYKDSIPVHFKNLLDELKARQEQPLTLGQEWWALVLLALKDLAEAEKYAYPTETIQFILNRIHTLTDSELEDYCNSINNAFYDEMPDVLSIRPLEVQKVHSDAYQNDFVLAYFLDKKEAFLNVFQKHMKEKDIEKMYINQLTVNKKEINEQFTDFWNTYFEIYTGFSISMYDMVSQHPQKTLEYREQVLKEVNLVFLIASLKNNAKMDALNNQLTELVRPLYLKDIPLT
ncbi:hypothetical protein CVD28_04350 [Bacillus sp. M6-12]|uniref:hypothetical protein n=1 Tax=Bacillus sp. M6-12 TaxID=2054166 RepID=UPI000C77E4FA|nr:hypothetical protein [Bacillus sp. M6-12]PLS19653.1 hypothetical protein CVD28_04350 [Bacillus sp. M6-12]